MDDKSTLVQVMAWCRQATSHYLTQGWLSSLSQCGVTRPQWVNNAEVYATYFKNLFDITILYKGNSDSHHATEQDYRIQIWSDKMCHVVNKFRACQFIPKKFNKYGHRWPDVICFTKLLKNRPPTFITRWWLKGNLIFLSTWISTNRLDLDFIIYIEYVYVWYIMM